MLDTMNTQTVPSFHESKRGIRPRKSGLNRNKEGSVRKVNGKVYVDFIYLGERVREPSGLPWNEKNVKHVRGQLDKIVVSVQSGTFRFVEVFPKSRKAEYFREKESELFGIDKTPDNVLFKEYAGIWYNTLKDSERVQPRTLWGYKRYLENYLNPFFGDLKFADINKGMFDKFVSWAKKQEYTGKPLSNNTVNKVFVPLKMICRDAALEYKWGNSYQPFLSYKKLPESDYYEKIIPFSPEEQSRIISELPDHWKPFFMFAFGSGLRMGEQISLKPEDINWSEGTIKISRALTLDDEGKPVMGKTKSKFSRRTIKIIPVMTSALEAQKKICEKVGSVYFFCSPTGKLINTSRLRQRVWIPALKKAEVPYREMKQTRHSFATNALIAGENPLWIAKVMGHRNTEMIIKVYGKFIENTGKVKDGDRLNEVYRGLIGNNE